MNLTESDYDEIQSLSQKGYTAKAIALTLGMLNLGVSATDIPLFLMFCNDINHPIGRAYHLGKLEIERIKNKKLMKKVKGGSETAILIHDKKQFSQEFKEAKDDIFSFYTLEDE